MGAHNTDHENNKIKQEHCKDLISLGLDQYSKLMGEKPASRQECSIIIRKIVLNLQHHSCLCVILSYLFLQRCVSLPSVSLFLG